MKTKLFTLLLAVAASIGTILAEKVQIGDLYYNLDATNKTAEVTYKSYTNYNYNEGWGITTANIPSSVTYNSVSYSVTSIGYGAFSDCSGLTSVTIPNSVTSIENGAFYGCSSLTSPVYNAHVFAFMPTSYSGAYTIPNGIESIAGYAFYGCTGLTSVTIPNSVTSIGDDAFSGTGLTSVTIPNSVTSIGNWAFSGCSGLTSVTIGNSVTSIGDWAFSYCFGLTSVTIPNSVTSIGDRAFWGCTGLTSVTIGNSVTSIGGYAFCGCTGLTFVTIPNSVTSIGDLAFYGCTGLTSIDVTSDNPNYYSEDGVLFNKTKTELIQYPIGNVRTEYTIPNNVTSIEAYAFYECTGLTSVTIPNSVTSIGDRAFWGCTGLTSITCEATTPPTCGSYAFKEVPKSIPLYVPFGSEDAYRNAAEWKDFTNIQPIKADNVDIIALRNVTDQLYETKFIRNGQLFIQRDGKTYSVTGQEVR